MIDFHTHPWLPDHLNPPTAAFIRRISPSVREHGDRLSDPRYAAAELRGQGVRRAVVLPEHCAETSGNVRTETVLEFCAAEPELYLPFASVNPNLDPDPAALLRGYVADGVRGLKLYPSYQYFFPNERRIYPIYEVCAEAGIPVLLHIGSSVIPGTRLKYCDPLHLDDVAVDFPELDLVLAHGGRGLWHEQCAFLARHHARIHIDVSGLVPERLLDLFPDLPRMGDKFVFGSDWPAMPKSVAHNVEAIRRLELAPDLLDRLFHHNAARLLAL